MPITDLAGYVLEVLMSADPMERGSGIDATSASKQNVSTLSPDRQPTEQLALLAQQLGRGWKQMDLSPSTQSKTTIGTYQLAKAKLCVTIKL